MCRPAALCVLFKCFNILHCVISQECVKNYDEEFANGVEQFLNENVNVSANNEDVAGDDFLKYIKIYLKTKKCPSTCSRLWLVKCLLREHVTVKLFLQELLFRQ